MISSWHRSRTIADLCWTFVVRRLVDVLVCRELICICACLGSSSPLIAMVIPQLIAISTPSASSVTSKAPADAADLLPAIRQHLIRNFKHLPQLSADPIVLLSPQQWSGSE
ncbi:hypothetical protein DPEC_G00212660 [Dallia pectoralis]|uniref:Uncharacterized protein n=1 Tax=Dallia pectoralis TaxID=75939 RepID=A0ACC2G602_DALPE|nr:hypothetical protein DPEC_G00212660 [Dallia pectoralis]